MHLRRTALRAALLLACPAGAAAQTLTLADALARAGQSAYPVRIAQGNAAAAAGGATMSLGGILPSVRVEASYLKTTDPLNAFGFTLRQRAVSLASFSPASLNYPAAIGNVGSGVVVDLPIFNADAWLGRSAALQAGHAASAAERWSRVSAGYDVARAYYGALLAADEVNALETALTAARAHVRQAESLLRNGAVTRSDALIASVKAGETEAMLFSARSEAGLSRRRLALALGSPGDPSWSLPASLPDATHIRAIALTVGRDSAAAPRADVEAAAYARAAADADVKRANALYVPRVNSFGRVDWNSPTGVFAGQDSWTAGIMVSWSPFSGGTQIGDAEAAKGRRGQAAAGAEAAAAQATLELRSSSDALAVALARLDIAERAVEQSAEAHRIVARKYDGGLASVVELFDAAAIEWQSRLSFAEARYQLIAAIAGRLRALGQGLDPLTSLDH